MHMISKVWCVDTRTAPCMQWVACGAMWGSAGRCAEPTCHRRAAMKFALGQPVPRTEDPRLLTGRGRYTDDFVLQRLAHAYVLRSPRAHAHIRSVDIRGAQQMPGVLAVLTGEDWAAEKFGAPRPVI